MIRGKFMTSMEDTTQCLAIREAVFARELNRPQEGAADENDRMAVYALVLNEEDEPAGSGRLYIDGDSHFAIDRVCVLKDQRGRGLGDLLMRMLLYRAQELSCDSVYLTAPVELTGFFARYGLKPQGDAKDGQRVMRAGKDEIDIEGTCHKGTQCAGCTGECASCDRKED